MDDYTEYLPKLVTEYDPKFDKIAYKLALLGCTNKEIAETLQICEKTLYVWMNKHESFANSIHDGGDLADAIVVESLFKRSIGMSYETKSITIDQITKQKKMTINENYCPPDVAAATRWLAVRRKNKDLKWTERSAHEITGPEGEPLFTISNDQKALEMQKRLIQELLEEDQEQDTIDGEIVNE